MPFASVGGCQFRETNSAAYASLELAANSRYVTVSSKELVYEFYFHYLILLFYVLLSHMIRNCKNKIDPNIIIKPFEHNWVQYLYSGNIDFRDVLSLRISFAILSRLLICSYLPIQEEYLICICTLSITDTGDLVLLSDTDSKSIISRS